MIEAMKTIPLTQGKVALIDDADFELVNQYKWQFLPKGTGYARALPYIPGETKRHTVLMHRLITQAKKGSIIDHINGDGLDNRRSNLRFCTFAENMRNKVLPKNNTTGFKGVYADTRRPGKYQASLRFEGRNRSLGYFDTAIEAAHAYNEAAKKYFGEFARLNEVSV